MERQFEISACEQVFNLVVEKSSSDGSNPRECDLDLDYGGQIED